MIITIVGAPDTGKGDVALKLNESLSIPATSGRLLGDEILVGPLADYRTELWLAADRAIYDRTKDRIFWHSLIDSMAYVSVRLAGIINVDPTNQLTITRWTMTFDMVLLMTQDGYKSDHTLYLPYKGDDEDSKEIDGGIRATLDSLEIPHKEINPTDEVETWLSK